MCVRGQLEGNGKKTIYKQNPVNKYEKNYICLKQMSENQEIITFVRF